MTYTRTTWSGVKVGDFVSLYPGTQVAVQRVVGGPEGVRTEGIAWYSKRRKEWVVTLFGPRFAEGWGIADPERDTLFQQPVWVVSP